MPRLNPQYARVILHKERPIRYRFICRGTEEAGAIRASPYSMTGAAGRAKAMPASSVVYACKNENAQTNCHTGVGGRIKESELREYWDEIEIDPAKRRALELALGL